MIKLQIEGPLIPWKSHRGFGRKSFNPLYKERQYVQWQIRQQYPCTSMLSHAVSIDYTFYFAIPKSTSKKKKEKMLKGEIRPTQRADCSNLQKFYEDTLKGIVITDDSIVVEGSFSKWYAEKPYVILKIKEISFEK